MEDGVGEAGTDGDPFDDALDVVDDDDVLGGLVGVGEDLVQVLDLGHLVEADHVLGRDELDEGELGGLRDAGCEGGLSGSWRAVEQHREQRRRGRVAHLVHEGPAIVEDVFDVWAVVQDATVYSVGELFFGDTKGGFHFVQGLQEVAPVNLHMLDIVGDACHRANFDMSVEGERRGGLD